jgi:hypothetical protein
MRDILWGLIALVVLGLLCLFAVRKSGYSHLAPSFMLVDDVSEDGLAALGFMILLLPLYPLILLVLAAWRWIHPVVPPPPLPVEGDDPVWGRSVNCKVVEAAFLAVQQAWARCDPEAVKDTVGPKLYGRLKAECDRLARAHQVHTRRDIQVQGIEICNERIDDYRLSNGQHAITYYLDATLRGMMTSYVAREADGEITAGTPEPHPFEEQMQFARGPGEDGRWVMVALSGLPRAHP